MVCTMLGPGTEIQGTGSLFCRKIGPPICWDFFADFGGGGCKYSHHPVVVIHVADAGRPLSIVVVVSRGDLATALI